MSVTCKNNNNNKAADVERMRMIAVKHEIVKLLFVSRADMNVKAPEFFHKHTQLAMLHCGTLCNLDTLF